MSTLLLGDGSFPFIAEIVGNDIEASGVIATWFGGPNDSQDNGETASGVSITQNPNILGCALPMDGFQFSKTNGSPIPKIPWKTIVKVTNQSNQSVEALPLIDLGPSKFASSHAAIDLTEAAFRALGGDPIAGTMKVNFVVVDGARYAFSGAPVSRSIKSSEKFSANRVRLLASNDTHGHTNEKPIIRQFIQSPNFSSRNGAAIDMIVMHFTDSPTAQAAINWFLNPASQVSAHYIVDRDGSIYQMVSDSDNAWHAKAANRTSIGIEHVSMPGWGMSSQQQVASIALVQWLVSTYDIPLQRILGHQFAPGNEGTTDCPDGLFGAETAQAAENWVSKNITS